MSWRRLREEAWARVTVWSHVRRQKRADPAWPHVRQGETGFVEAAIGGLWDDFDHAPERLTPAQSAVLHAWTAHGLVGNGGMPSLIESMGDRGAAVVDGYRVLGLPACAAAVAQALALYPDAGAPEPDERLAVHETWADDGPEETELSRLGDVISHHDDRLIEAAVRFIRDHPADFPVAPR